MGETIIFSFPIPKFTLVEDDYIEIYKKYYDAVLHNALTICNCKTTSEDIAQDVFLKLWINKEKLKNVREIENYMFVMTKHLAFDHIKKKKNKKFFEQKYSFCYSQTINRNSYDTKELRSIVNNALEKLSQQQKTVYFLKREEGRSRIEIAQTLKISENTVRVTMQKALKALRKNITVEMVA